jgi:hypothetical protein
LLWAYAKSGVGGDHDNGNWGGGTLTANGNTLDAAGEGHGAIQFLGTFPTITWTATNGENWNGITVGYDQAVSAVPEPGTFALLGVALAGLAFSRKRPLR